MAEVVVLVLDNPDNISDVLNAWLQVGVPGVTMLDSAGLGHTFATEGARADLPLLPSLASLLQPREDPSRLLFSVVPDGFDTDALIAATEAVTGSLDAPNTGILFVLPVSKTRGVHPRRPGHQP
jgi:hypothetical protein